MARTLSNCFAALKPRSCLAARSASRFSVWGSTSTNTGVAPALTIALAEAKKLNGVVMTESPGLTPAETSASQRASVPDAQPTAKVLAVRALAATLLEMRTGTSQLEDFSRQAEVKVQRPNAAPEGAFRTG